MKILTFFFLIVSIITAQSFTLERAVSSKIIPIRASSENCLDYRLIHPFSNLTTLTLDIKEDTNMNISIYSKDREFITDLVHQLMFKGRNTMTWDGKNYKGELVSHDVIIHVCRLETLLTKN